MTKAFDYEWKKRTPNVNVVSNETFTMTKERGMNQSANADDKPFNLFSHTKKIFIQIEKGQSIEMLLKSKKFKSANRVLKNT